eukprot:scaffold10153_cov111-Isochrysis_galbana.AAC.4
MTNRDEIGHCTPVQHPHPPPFAGSRCALQHDTAGHAASHARGALAQLSPADECRHQPARALHAIFSPARRDYWLAERQAVAHLPAPDSMSMSSY